MRHRRPLLSQQQERPLAVDISPLLDVVFILLIFFIVSAVFVRETGVEIDRPKASSGELVAERSVLLALTEAGEVWYSGAQIGMAGVAPLLKQMSDRPVVIQADRQIDAGRLIALVDLCKLSTSAQVSVATTREP